MRKLSKVSFSPKIFECNFQFWFIVWGRGIWRSVRPKRTSLIGSGNVTPFALKASATTKVIHPKYYEHLKEASRLGRLKMDYFLVD